MKVKTIDRNCISLEKDGKTTLLNREEAYSTANDLLDALQYMETMTEEEVLAFLPDSTDAEIVADLAAMEYKSEKAV